MCDFAAYASSYRHEAGVKHSASDETISFARMRYENGDISQRADAYSGTMVRY